jgi:hypothetical protein
MSTTTVTHCSAADTLLIQYGSHSITRPSRQQLFLLLAPVVTSLLYLQGMGHKSLQMLTLCPYASSSPGPPSRRVPPNRSEGSSPSTCRGGMHVLLVYSCIICLVACPLKFLAALQCFGDTANGLLVFGRHTLE